MSSRGKKKTTMAKLTRESRLRERRVEKAARKDARRNAPAVDSESADDTAFTDGAALGDEAPVADEAADDAPVAAEPAAPLRAEQ